MAFCNINNIIEESNQHNITYHPDIVWSYLNYKKAAPPAINQCMTLDSWVKFCKQNLNDDASTQKKISKTSFDLNIKLNPKSRRGTRFKIESHDNWYTELCLDIARQLTLAKISKMTSEFDTETSEYNNNRYGAHQISLCYNGQEINKFSVQQISKFGPIEVRLNGQSDYDFFEGNKTPLCPMKYACHRITKLRKIAHKMCCDSLQSVTDKISSCDSWDGVKSFIRKKSDGNAQKSQCKNTILSHLSTYFDENSNLPESRYLQQHLSYQLLLNNTSCSGIHNIFNEVHSEISHKIHRHIISVLSGDSRNDLIKLFRCKKEIKDKINLLNKMVDNFNKESLSQRCEKDRYYSDSDDGFIDNLSDDGDELLYDDDDNDAFGRFQKINNYVNTNQLEINMNDLLSHQTKENRRLHFVEDNAGGGEHATMRVSNAIPYLKDILETCSHDIKTYVALIFQNKSKIQGIENRILHVISTDIDDRIQDEIVKYKCNFESKISETVELFKDNHITSDTEMIFTDNNGEKEEEEEEEEEEEKENYMYNDENFSNEIENIHSSLKENKKIRMELTNLMKNFDKVKSNNGDTITNSIGKTKNLKKKRKKNSQEQKVSFSGFT